MSVAAAPLPPNDALRWVMARNCALTPAQTLASLSVMCALQATVALGFWWLGYPVVAAFSAAAALAFAGALLGYAHHACDRETVVLQAGELQVEQRCGSHVQRCCLCAAWVRVRPAAGTDPLVELAAGDACVQVGRYLRPGPRARFANELQRALRAG